jgi:hypothetical protein
MMMLFRSYVVWCTQARGALIVKSPCRQISFTCPQDQIHTSASEPFASQDALVSLRLYSLRYPVWTTYSPEQFCSVPKDFSCSITLNPSDLLVSLKISNGTSSILSILTYDNKRKIVCPSKLPHSFNCTPPFWCFFVGYIGR